MYPAKATVRIQGSQFSLRLDEELFVLPPPQTPQVPPPPLQCLHELQVEHALQFADPVHLPA